MTDPLLQKYPWLIETGTDTYHLLKDFSLILDPIFERTPDLKRCFNLEQKHKSIHKRTFLQEVLPYLIATESGKNWTRNLNSWIEENQVYWDNTDRNYWNSLFKNIKNIYFVHFPKEDYYKTGLVKYLKQLRYEKRLEATRSWFDDTTPEERYGSFIGNRLQSEIHKMTEKLDFVDNIRFAKVSSKKEMKHYKRHKNQGCCGFMDKTITIFFQKYMIGCNYGH